MPHNKTNLKKKRGVNGGLEEWWTNICQKFRSLPHADARQLVIDFIEKAEVDDTHTQKKTQRTSLSYVNK